MSPQPFVHLRLHTEFSLQDSVVRIPELVERAAQLGMPAVAVTDQNNLFAMVKFYREALKQGVKPIIGVDVLLRARGERAVPSRLTLLCKDPGGYQNVTNLITRAWLEGQDKGIPLIDRAWLDATTTSGLIALSGAADGDVGRALIAGREPEAMGMAREWQALFGDRYYLELQRLGRAEDEALVTRCVALSQKTGIAVVATNDVRFLTAADFESHEARVCIAEGAQLADPARPRRYTDAQYLRSPEEMARLFADIPEALRNSVEIARRCSLPLKLGESRLPVFPLPEGVSVETYIREESERGFATRAAAFDEAQRARIDEYRQRLDSELVVISKMGFAGYFLIVADFIRWARANGVPVGPGRGSGAGSLVAYSLGITDIDPLKYDLLFERFLNPERVSMPDFDIDFCMDGRDRVIEYVSQKYGRERVSQIITYGTMAAKAVVRDVGRVLGMGYGYVDKIAKLIPFELGITLDDALEKEPELKRLYKEDEEIKNLIDLAKSLEGLTRNAGMHAGGVVIAPSKLTEFAPLYADDKGGSVVTQFDKDDVEAAGLVKFDFLGLRTLTVISRAVKIINALRAEKGEAPLDISALPMDDKATYALMSEAQDHGGVPAGIPWHEGSHSPAPARPVRGHRGAGGAVPPGSAGVGHGRRLHRPQAQSQRSTRAAHRLSASPVAAGDGTHVRRHPVPGTGDADRAGARRLHARRRRPFAQRHGQEEARGNGQAAFDLRDGRREEQRARIAGRVHLRPHGEVRGLRLQQVAFGRVRVALVPDRLAEGP